MHQRRDDDLFRDTTMTFGEHLEELRACLFKALLGLVIGVGLGLWFGDSVVRFIQMPLQEALVDYYEESAKEEWQKDNDELVASGQSIQHDSTLVEGLIENEGMIPESLYILSDDLARELAAADPELAGNLERRANPPGHLFSRVGPTTVVPGDFQDPIAICQQLVAAGDAPDARSPARRVWDLLTTADRKQVHEFSALAKLSDEQRKQLAKILTRVVQSGLLYDAKMFGEAKVSPEAERFLKRETLLTGAERQRWSRVLLESAFPQELAATHPDLLKMTFWRPTEKTPMMRPVTLNAQEAFMIYMKASVVAGIVLSSPWVFYQLWAFVAAGLYPHEKRYVHIFLPFSLGLFLAGASLAFFFVFKPVLSFLFSFNRWLNIDPTPRISEWLSFVLMLPLGFGISFQLPLVMLFMERIGIVSVETYLSKWRIAIMAIFVIAAVLTPADPWSMILMALPLTVLYYAGVQLCRYMPRGRSPFDEQPV